MPLDLARLESMNTFTDDDAGIIERFVHVPLESGSTVGVLSLPVGTPGTTAWVITHSFGPEHLNLNALDVAIARQLAARGSPVLRFHCQGYGDSERERFIPSIDSHVQDTIDAAHTIREMTGTRSIGIIGTRFGGSIALIAGTRVGADRLVLISPAVRGSRFLRELVRAGAIIELAKSGLPDDTENAWTVLKAGGSVSIRGSVITGDHYRSFDALDLGKAPPFAGSTLLVHVTTGTQPRRDLSELSERLSMHGAIVTTSIVMDRSAALLGERHFRPVGGDFLGDVASELHAKISGAVVEWCADVPKQIEPRGRGGR